MATSRRAAGWVEHAEEADSTYARIQRFFQQTIWQEDARRLGRLERTRLLALRLIYLTSRSVLTARVQLQASALTYVSILALVPSLALVFTIFQAFGGLEGAGARVEDLLVSSLAATPQQAEQLHEWLPQLIGGMHRHLQSSGGIAGGAVVFLVVTVVALLGSVEHAMNEVWGVKQSRPYGQRFVLYWAAATLGPVFLGVALAMGSTLWARASVLLAPAGAWVPPEAAEGAALASQIFSQGIAVVLTGLGFTLLYALLPNTRVHWTPALVGGFVASLLWALSRWALTSFSSALVQYNTVYGSLATIPILMFWLYVSWIVVLLGAQLTFATQNIEVQGREELAAAASERCREEIGLHVASQIAAAFRAASPPPAVTQLASQIGVPVTLVNELVIAFCEASLVREVQLPDGERGYVPARPLAEITVDDLLGGVRRQRGVDLTVDGDGSATDDGESLARVEHALRTVRGAEAAAARAMTLADLSGDPRTWNRADGENDTAP